MEYYITHEDNLYFANCDKFNIYGFGKTKSEAISELKLHFNYFREYYLNTPDDKLIGEALRIKKEYEKLVRRKS